MPGDFTGLSLPSRKFSTRKLPAGLEWLYLLSNNDIIPNLSTKLYPNLVWGNVTPVYTPETSREFKLRYLHGNTQQGWAKANDTYLGDISVFAWFKYAATSSTFGQVVGKIAGSGYTNNWSILYHPGAGYYWGIGDSVNHHVISIATLNNDVWSMAAFTFKYSTLELKCYINKTLVSTSTSGTTPTNAVGNMAIGRRNDSILPPIGYVGLVGAYNRVISDREITSIYENTKGLFL